MMLLVLGILSILLILSAVPGPRVVLAIMRHMGKLLLAGNQAQEGLGRSFGSSVGWERLGWERSLVREGMRIRVNDTEDTGSTLSKSHHIEHHHVSQKFTNSDIKESLK